MFRIWMIPPVLLAVVASSQIIISQTTSLSHWKGGGFGMFSEIASPDMRRVTVLGVSKDENVYQVKLDTSVLSRHYQRLRTFPSDERAQALASELLMFKWQVLPNQLTKTYINADQGIYFDKIVLSLDEIVLRDDVLQRINILSMAYPYP